MNIADVEPLGQRLLVQRYEPETTAGEDGVIQKPDIAIQQNAWARVIMTGPDVSTIRSGDSVVVSLYGGTEVDLGGDTYLIIDEKELLLRVPGGATKVLQRVLTKAAIDSSKSLIGNLSKASEDDEGNTAQS